MVRLNEIPYPLEWNPEPVESSYENGVLRAVPGPQTDLFVDPLGRAPILNAPKLLFDIEGDFILSSRVKVGFQGTYDAGILAVYQHETSWAKLCFEMSPQGQPMVVSVVTKGTSDDCNSLPIEGNQIYLRLSHIGNAFAFHYSLDTKFWHMVRVFRLEPGPFKTGFLVQAPVGDGCTVEFSEIRLEPRRLNDIRSGE
ncbi:MAG: DUF1349 domain-containing protein [Meiothermus sp.]